MLSINGHIGDVPAVRNPMHGWHVSDVPSLACIS